MEHETLESLDDSAAPASETLGSAETLATQSRPNPAAGLDALPSTLGRYRIHGVLGRGGMGIVYAAHDPELEREVALKVLSAGRHSEVARARLRREARTLAKLAHPNVVSVHDVGEQHGQLYLAMERIKGSTLGAWVRVSVRRWPELLAVFVAAGRGLVAAHEAGLVHRDFKPDNLLIDELGVPHVLDFGLARVVEDAASSGDEAEQRDDNDDRAGAADEPLRVLTRAGAIMGTPAYMAPEQHLGDTTDARTDQYAFCLTLWEALYGERPFSGKTQAALAEAVITGQINAAPRRGVPRAIQRALRRGLEADPERRWPSMAALLDALAAVPRRRRRAAMGAGVTALMIGLVAGTSALSREPAAAAPPICVDTGARVDSVWSAARSRSIAAALELAGGEEVTPTRALVLGGLDSYASSLRAGFGQACLDTEQRQLVSPALRDRRVSCLIARVDALDAAAALLESIDRAGLRHATQLIQALPSIDRCADLPYLEARLPEPDNEADAQRVNEARRQLSRAEAALTTVNLDEAEAALAEASRVSADLDYAPLAVELGFARGRLATQKGEYEQAAAQIEDAYHQAFGLGHDELAINASLELVFAIGYDLREPERGMEWTRHAESLLDRSADQLRRGDLLHNRGEMYMQLGELDQAQALFEQALQLKRRQLGPRDPSVARSLNNLSNVLDRLGHRDQARAALEQAVSIKLETLGEHSSSTAGSLTNLGLLLWKQGEAEAAVAHHEHALRIFERAYGPQHRSVAGTSLNLGKALCDADRASEALPVLARALDIIAADQRPSPPMRAQVLNAIALANYRLERWALARESYAAELELRVSIGGEDDPELASPLLGLAEVAHASGDHEQASHHAQRVLALHAGSEGDPVQLADAHLILAEALIGMGKHEDARAHAVLARDAFAAAGGRHLTQQREAEALLAALD